MTSWSADLQASRYARAICRDGLMVIFNDPVKSPNPALQAVQMAIEIRAL